MKHRDLQTAVNRLFNSADDMALVGLLLNEGSSVTYLLHASLLNEWCNESFLEVSARK